MLVGALSKYYVRNKIKVSIYKLRTSNHSNMLQVTCTSAWIQRQVNSFIRTRADNSRPSRCTEQTPARYTLLCGAAQHSPAGSNSSGICITRARRCLCAQPAPAQPGPPGGYTAPQSTLTTHWWMLSHQH